MLPSFNKTLTLQVNIKDLELPQTVPIAYI